MRDPSTLATAFFAVAAVVLVGEGSQTRASVEASPPSVVLDGPEATQQLLLLQTTPNQPSVDRTRQVQFDVLDARIAIVSPTGRIEPRDDGRTEIVVRHSEGEVRIPVAVKGYRRPAPISFEHQVVPILSKAGCNAGGCHGKAEGQNGFKLSVFGFDPWADYQALVMEGRGRRVFPAAPQQSLLLRKATAQSPHGGGKKIAEGSRAYRRLVRWIAEGTPFDSAAVAPIAGIEVEPIQRILALDGSQQLRVTAIDAKGNRFDVTAETQYDSNAQTIAAVDPEGWIQANKIPGEAAILARYMGQVAVCRITIPRPGVQFTRPPETNFVDRHIWNKLHLLGIPPSAPADDATFLRRVFLDVIGTLPTAVEAKTFLGDKSPGKRAALIEHVLVRPEYADFWAMRWADVLRVDRDKISAQGSVAMTRWLRRQFAENRPYDRFIRDILLAQGNTTAEGPASFLKSLDRPEVISRSFSQLVLGVRIECAQCHHHPSEKWGQEDYFGLAGFFTGVGRKPLPGGGEAVYSRGGNDLNHPRTGKPVSARALGAKPADFANSTDRRVALADWMTAGDNPYFAKAIANRLWAHYFGRGLVEPIDDQRATNPATNEPLLDELAKHLRDVRFDLKTFTKTLLNSRAYQLDSQANAANADDVQNFSHVLPKALPAEVLLDAICQATGVAEKYNGWPEGYRAIQIWDNRMPTYFFQIFGRPGRNTVCECERSNEPSIAQALNLMNSPELNDKIRSRQGVARRLADGNLPPQALIDELFLTALARYPTEKERTPLAGALAPDRSERRAFVEDVLWALLNSKEFLYNH